MKSRAALEEFSLMLPYADRQKLLVVPDEVARADRQALRELELSKDAKKPKFDADVFVNALAEALAGVFPLERAAVKLIVEAVAKIRERGIEVITIGRSEADLLRMDPGHPLEDIMYVGHPAVPEIYYPGADFHRRVFEQKFCEAVELLMALGATKIDVERQSGYSRDASAEIDVPLSPRERIGMKLGRKSGQKSELLFEAGLPGNDEPTVPDDLVWFSSERTWQTLARARTEHRAKNFGLVVRYESDYGITSKLKAQVEGVGLSMGGSFQEQRDTVWRLTAVFSAA